MLKHALIVTALVASASVAIARDLPQYTANGPGGTVVLNGEILGQDPDLNIRMSILREGNNGLDE
jgi:hypothetical protein